MKIGKIGIIMVLMLLHCITARGYEPGGKYDFYHDGIYYQIIAEEETEMWVAVERGEEEYTNSLWILPEFTYNGKVCYVKWIGWDAFEACWNLTAVFIPSSVDFIHYSAFRHCPKLTTIAVVGDNPYYDSRNECNAVIERSSNTLIAGCPATIIPEDVVVIGECAFSSCDSLKSITIPDNVTEIRGGAFLLCQDLETVTISENSKLTSIGHSAFSLCSSLTSITIPKGVTLISEAAFYGCSGLRDVYCFAENAPTNGDWEGDSFESEEIKNITLHVPLSAIDSYRTTAPWSSFGKIVAIGVSVTDIVLNQTAATMVEGGTLELMANVLPEVADNSIVWSSSNESVAVVDDQGRVVAIAPGTVTITATAADDSGISSSCEIIVKKDIIGQCSTPTVAYSNGKVRLACDTEGAKFITEIVSQNEQSSEEAEFDFVPTYTFTTYATKARYENSDTVSVTLCWLECTENNEKDDDTGVLNILSQPVLIQMNNATIFVSGLSDDIEVVVYDLAGNLLGATTAIGGTAELATGLEVGSTAIVQIGNNRVKVIVK